MISADLPDLAAIEIRRLVAARQISAVAVVEACLERVVRHNERLNAIVTINERALDDARDLDDRLARGEPPGPLCGLPVGIKDVTPVAGLRTTYGSPIFADHVAAEDAVVVRRLRAAGAIILGKTNTPEFAAGGNTWNDVFGRTCNPWDPARSAGGSTGGGCAALAAGMVALADGTDLGGSLRIPASFCGVVGLRPSVGLVPTHPAGWVWDTLQVSGPVARTVADVALALQVMAGPDPRAPLGSRVDGRDFEAAVRRGPSPDLRIAYCPDIAGIGVDADIEQVCRRAALELTDIDAAVDVIALDLGFARPAFLTLRGVWFLSWLHEHLGHATRFGVNVANNVRSGLETPALDIADAEAARGRVWHLFRELFERYDFLLTPTMAVPPFPVEQNYPDTVAGRQMETYVDWIAPTFLLSLTGLPVVSVPCGLDGDGLPVGMQIVGKPLGEEAVLALAAEVQNRHPIGLPRLP